MSYTAISIKGHRKAAQSACSEPTLRFEFTIKLRSVYGEHGRTLVIRLCTVFHAKRVECAIFHLLVARSTYDISSSSPIFGNHCDTNDKVSHDSHVTQLPGEVTRF